MQALTAGCEFWCLQTVRVQVWNVIILSKCTALIRSFSKDVDIGLSPITI